MSLTFVVIFSLFASLCSFCCCLATSFDFALCVLVGVLSLFAIVLQQWLTLCTVSLAAHSRVCFLFLALPKSVSVNLQTHSGCRHLMFLWERSDVSCGVRSEHTDGAVGEQRRV